VLQAKEMLDHASRLVGNAASTDADYRRAVSASYYAVFHLISAAVAEQACPPTPHGLRGRFQRGLEHGVMKNAMEIFQDQQKFPQHSTKLGIPCGFSSDIAEIAELFGELYYARQFADYEVEDSKGTVKHSWASGWVDKARLVFDDWDRAKSTEEAKFFLASLIFGNKWAKQP
jgi:hypothetical protein